MTSLIGTTQASFALLLQSARLKKKPSLTAMPEDNAGNPDWLNKPWLLTFSQYNLGIQIFVWNVCWGIVNSIA